MVAAHERYILKVSAGPDYDTASHTIVNVNTSKGVHLSTNDLDVTIRVCVQDYRGLPESSPSSSDYFSHANHTSDRYSIAFSFTPKHDIPGNALVFGNDFDHPIRDRLPPGFSYAFRIVKWMIDPGIDGDVYADEPYLYGPLLSSVNVLHIGDKDGATHLDPEKRAGGDIFEEGASGTGEEVRKAAEIPHDIAARRKFFLDQHHREGFTFEKHRTYDCDFFNPYLDFNEFALKLPGFTLPIIKYWDGQPLRYVLRNNETKKPLFVVIFELLPREMGSDEEAEDDEEEEDEHSSHGKHHEDEKITSMDELKEKAKAAPMGGVGGAGVAEDELD